MKDGTAAGHNLFYDHWIHPMDGAWSNPTARWLWPQGKPWTVSVVVNTSWRFFFGWSRQQFFFGGGKSKLRSRFLEHFPIENRQKQPWKAALLMLYSLTEAIKCDLRKVGVCDWCFVVGCLSCLAPSDVFTLSCCYAIKVWERWAKKLMWLVGAFIFVGHQTDFHAL